MTRVLCVGNLYLFVSQISEGKGFLWFEVLHVYMCAQTSL